MKISLALLILLLVAACTGNQGFHSSGSNCCKRYYPGKIPESKIQDYNYTPCNCKLKAVRLKVPVGWLCVKPETTWVKKYLDNLKKSNSTCT